MTGFKEGPWLEGELLYCYADRKQKINSIDSEEEEVTDDETRKKGINRPSIMSQYCAAGK